MHADTVLRLNKVSSAYIITSAKDNLYGHFQPEEKGNRV